MHSAQVIDAYELDEIDPFACILVLLGFAAVFRVLSFFANEIQAGRWSLSMESNNERGEVFRLPRKREFVSREVVYIEIERQCVSRERERE